MKHNFLLKASMLLLTLLGGSGSALAQITDVSELSNNKVYTLTTPARGSWASTVNGNKMTSTNETADLPDVNKQFALLNINGGYYIYSVAAKKFVRPTNVLLADKGTNVQFNDQGDNTFVIKAVGQNLYANIGGSNQFAFDGWGAPDEGNKLTIAEVADVTFDPTEAIAIWTADNAFGHKVFTITSERGNWTVNDAGTALTSATVANMNSSDEKQQWTILRFDGKYYIYNVGAKKYLKKDGSLFEGKGDPININRVANDNGYPYMLNTEDAYYFNMQNAGGFSINNYSTPDPGNQQAFNVIEDKDVYDEAYELFTAVPVTVNYNIYYNGTLVETLTGIDATATKPAELPAANINGLYSYTYEPAIIAEETTDVTVTATWNGLFTFSADYDNANWYNMYIRNAGYYISYVEDATQYPVTKNCSNAQLASDAFQWAFIDGGYGKVQVINKAAGNGKTLKADGNPLMRDGSTSWDIFKGGEGFVLRETGTANNYINQNGGDNGNFAFWDNGGARNDAGSRLYLTEVPEVPVVNVTYSVKFNNVEVATATIPAQEGVAIPEVPSELNRNYVTFSYDDTQLASEGLTVDVTAIWSASAPFQISTNENPTWYTLKIRDDGENTTTVVTYQSAATPNVQVETSATGLDNQQWAFVGNPYALSVINRANTSATLGTADNNNGTVATLGSDGTKYYVTPSTNIEGKDGFYIRNTEGGYGLNLQGGQLKYWNGLDVGSTFTVEDVPELTDFASLVETEIYPYIWYTGEYFSLKSDVVNENWNDSYLQSCDKTTYEKLSAIVNDLSNFKLPETGYYRIKNKNTYASLYLNGCMALNAAGTELTTVHPINAAADYSTVIKLTKVSDMVYTISTQGLNINDLTPTAEAGSNFTFRVKAPGFVSMTAGSDGSSLHWQEAGNKLVHWNSSADASHWAVKDADSITVSVTAAGFATLYVPFALETPTGVTVYTAKSLAGDKSVIVLNEVTGTIPAATAVLLKADAGTYTFRIASDADAIDDNVFSGTYITKPVASGTCLTLQNNATKGIGFYPFTGASIRANSAYIDGTSADIKELTVLFDDDATGLNEVNGGWSMFNGQCSMFNGQCSIYNLAGQRIGKMQKGINIIGGRKVIVK